MSHVLTNEEIIDNIHNKAWRMRNLYYIVDKNKKKILFRPNYAQSFLIDSKERYKAVLKARQLGVSTYSIIDLLDDTIWTENQTCVILAHEQDSIKKLFRIARFAYENLPPIVKPRISKGGGSQYEMYFPAINSRIYCDLESRGDTISSLHVSEYAFVRDPDKVKATIDAVPLTTGKVSMETTPNGMNHFYKEWHDPNWPYKKFFFPWFFDPAYQLPVEEPLKLTDKEKILKNRTLKHWEINLTDEQIQFRRFKIAQKGFDHFIQEFGEDDETCFLMSGEVVIDRFFVNQLLKTAPTPDHWDEKKGLQIWEDFDEHCIYVCGADVAEGVGKDYSVASLWNVTKRRLAAQIRGQYRPSDFADHINRLCMKYTNKRTMPPLLAVERNNHGHAVLLKLDEVLNYSNLYRADDDRLGWKTNSLTRPLMIDAFIEALEDRTINVKSKFTLGECLTLVDNNGKIEAAEGMHDDCIIAEAIALQVFRQAARLSGLLSW